MDNAVRDSVRLRSSALWCATTAAAAGIGLLTVPTLAAGPGLVASAPAFTDLLVTGCAAASLLATGWLWAITTDVVVGVLAARDRVVVRRPGPVRLLLLAACGAVALSTTPAPASADDRRPVVPHSLSGLPLPDRANGDGLLPERADTASRSMVRVRPGDSLWAIAEERLGSGATVADLVDYWHRIYLRNADVIGPDPDLILPGQLLELPPMG
jgi:nucleoid-associated protein YgaU